MFKNVKMNILNLKLDNTHLDHVGLVSHAADLGHISHLLLDQGSFKCHQHEQREDTVVPVLVQTPKPYTEHLMDGRQWTTSDTITR